jgi:hypothetical protein
VAWLLRRRAVVFVFAVVSGSCFLCFSVMLSVGACLIWMGHVKTSPGSESKVRDNHAHSLIF